MKVFCHLFLYSLMVLSSLNCSRIYSSGTADFNRDGVISDEEYERFNTEKATEAEGVIKESMERRKKWEES